MENNTTTPGPGDPGHYEYVTKTGKYAKPKGKWKKPANAVNPSMSDVGLGNVPKGSGMKKDLAELKRSREAGKNPLSAIASAFTGG